MQNEIAFVRAVLLLHGTGGTKIIALSSIGFLAGACDCHPDFDDQQYDEIKPYFVNRRRVIDQDLQAVVCVKHIRFPVMNGQIPCTVCEPEIF